MVPVLFIAKRLAFVSVLIVANEFLWVQVALMNFTALASVSFTLWYMPMETKQANLFDAFNDCTLLLLTYLLWCFSDIVGEAETRYDLGYWFIGINFGNIAVHIIFMIAATILSAKLFVKRCKNRRNAK